MKRRKLSKNAFRKTKRARTEQKKHNLLGYENLEPRRLLAGDFAPFVDNFTTDWAGDIFAGTARTDRGRDVAVQPDGKYLVAGLVSKDQYQQHQDMMVVRYNADFSPDTSFGNNGLASADFGALSRDYGHQIKLQADGRILVVGTGYGYLNQEIVTGNGIAARFSADGTLEATYQQASSVEGGFTGIVQQSDGKYVILARTKITNDKYDVVLTRLNSDFTVDTNFGSGGTVVHDFNGGVANLGNALLQRSDGTLLVVGSATGLGYYVLFNPDGSTTGIEATIDTSTLGRNEFISAVLDSNDNVYMLGHSYVDAAGVDAEIAVVKVDANFAQDLTYGDNGVFRFNVTPQFDQPKGAVLDSNGYLVVSGGVTDVDIYVARATPAGILDTGFADNGIAHIGTSGFIGGVAVDNGDRIITTGEQVDVTMDTWVVRVNPNVELADSFEVSEVGEWNGMWFEDNQNDWYRSTQRSTDGSFSAEVDGRATDAALTSFPIDMSAYGSAELNFDWFIESGFDAGEYLHLEFFDGTAWTPAPIRSLDGNVDQENIWHNEVVELGSAYLVSDFQFRFRSTVSSSNEDANVDDVWLIGTSLAGPVSPPNEAPAITTSAITAATQDALYAYNVDATDPDAGDVLTFSLISAPAGMAIDASSGFILWTPGNNDVVGSNSVSVVVTDTGGLFDVQSFSITVANVNDEPTITSTPVTVANEDSLYNYDVDASDPDIGDSLTYSLDSAPTGMTINSTSGLIQWTPTGAQLGANSVTVRVQDVGGLFQTQSYSITVSEANGAPTFTSSAVTTATEDALYSYNVDASDPNIGDTLTYSLDTAPAGMSIDSNTGLIQWTPTNDDIGANPVTVRVEDGGGLIDTQSFNIDVANVNDAPTITSTPVTAATEATLYTYDIDADDPDVNDTLTFSLDVAPAGMTVDGSTGLIQWTPASGQIGNHSVTVRANDLAGASDTQGFVVTVNAAIATLEYSASPGTDIPDQGTITSVINVSEDFDILDLNIEVNITHKSDADLDVFLIAPDGTRIELFTDVGGGGDDFNGTILDDEASTLISDGSAPFNGIFRPEGNLSIVEGNPNFTTAGDWKLEITDDKRRRTGTLNSWTLKFEVTSALLGNSLVEINQASLLSEVQVAGITQWAEKLWGNTTAPSGAPYEIRIADLPGQLLGATSGRTITIDSNAAGLGWFVDATPWESSEFAATTSIGNQYDLLTVLAHELGHFNGHHHEQAGVMEGTLDVNMRQLPEKTLDQEIPKLVNFAFTKWTQSRDLVTGQIENSNGPLNQFRMESVEANRWRSALRSNNHSYYDNHFQARINRELPAVGPSDRLDAKSDQPDRTGNELVDRLFGDFDQLFDEFELVID